ncbi:MAG: holo-[acyl-carrier protein] synthase [Planctomycetota bacterium]|jgi:holo-[acyl-carrier protein] synthase
MTIHSIGSDLAQIDRLAKLHARQGQKVLDRLFTAEEQTYCDARKQRFTHYAGRFAVKEAVMKLLGTGWAKGVRWVDIEVLRESESAPQLRLHGRTKEIAVELGIVRIHITITHDAGLAMAFAVAER